ncbi:hypothetical protein RSAG8_03386, partial [Rhizoctonia solani AG-8 WAC10335]
MLFLFLAFTVAIVDMESTREAASVQCRRNVTGKVIKPTILVGLEKLFSSSTEVISSPLAIH